MRLQEMHSKHPHLKADRKGRRFAAGLMSQLDHRFDPREGRTDAVDTGFGETQAFFGNAIKGPFSDTRSPRPGNSKKTLGVQHQDEQSNLTPGLLEAIGPGRAEPLGEGITDLLGEIARWRGGERAQETLCRKRH